MHLNDLNTQDSRLAYEWNNVVERAFILTQYQYQLALILFGRKYLTESEKGLLHVYEQDFISAKQSFCSLLETMNIILDDFDENAVMEKLRIQYIR